MKKIIVLLVLCIPSISIFAQPDSLLKKFRYRIAHYRAVTFNAGGGSQYDEANFPVGTHKNGASAAGLSGNYYFTTSTDKKLLTASLGLNGVFSRSKSKDQTSSNTNKSFSTVPSISISNKWFSKKMFTELGTDILGSVLSSKNIFQGNPAATKNNQANYTATVTMGIGKGRLENVTDMQNALWLYKELGNVQRLAGTLSATDLLELGQNITKGNNTRVLDARKRTQFLLTTVDNYLQQKGLISKTDIAYFSSLNDILFYAYNNPRFTGTEKFIRLTPGLTGVNNNQFQSNGIDKNKQIFNTKSVMLSTGFKKYCPTSLSHQNNFGAALNFSYTNADFTDRNFSNGIITNELKGETDLKKAGANLFYEHAIYPNTRTNINLNLQADFGYQNDDTRKIYTDANLFCNLNYFISYRTRINFGAGAFYQRNMYTISNYVELKANSFQVYATGGLQVSL